MPCVPPGIGLCVPHNFQHPQWMLCSLAVAQWTCSCQLRLGEPDPSLLQVPFCRRARYHLCNHRCDLLEAGCVCTSADSGLHHCPDDDIL